MQRASDTMEPLSSRRSVLCFALHVCLHSENGIAAEVCADNDSDDFVSTDRVSDAE